MYETRAGDKPNIQASGEPAYFKSTDGHFGNWNFNLRRPNLHLLPLIIQRHGLVFHINTLMSGDWIQLIFQMCRMILVDSTRAGKRIPDALSKTVPIWCAVINRAISRLRPEAPEWPLELYTPPGAVSEQEHTQIERRIDSWADSLAVR